MFNISIKNSSVFKEFKKCIIILNNCSIVLIKNLLSWYDSRSPKQMYEVVEFIRSQKNLRSKKC